ncbi:prepilin peptidase, partial [Sporomusa sp.]
MFFVLIIIILGASLGSFLNVCIYRLPINKSIILPPSHCV